MCTLNLRLGLILAAALVAGMLASSRPAEAAAPPSWTAGPGLVVGAYTVSVGPVTIPKTWVGLR